MEPILGSKETRVDITGVHFVGSKFMDRGTPSGVKRTMEADFDPQELFKHGTIRTRKLCSNSTAMGNSVADSRRVELPGFLDNGTFIPTSMDVVPDGTRIFGSRFVDELDKSGPRRLFKIRFVAQNYADQYSANIRSKAPTVQRFSERLPFVLA